MRIFEIVKENINLREAAELYGIDVNRYGKALCPFHNDRHPSLYVADDHYYCFACGEHGDVIDFVSRLFGLPCRKAAVRLADDFGICYDSRRKRSTRPHVREPTPEQNQQKEETHCYRVLTGYLHLLLSWEREYAPGQPEEAWNPLFVEALQRKDYTEYLLDILLSGSLEERKALVAEQRKEVMKLEQRIAEWSADSTLYHRGSPKQLGAERER